MNVLSLVQEIKHAAITYYNIGGEYDNPSMTDEEFNAKVDELRSIDPTHPILTTTGWGAESDDWDVPHWSHNGGLSECKFENSDPEGTDLSEGVISEKLDGLTIVARYSAAGMLIDCITRGNGDFGKDVTAMAIAAGVPTDLKTTFEMPIELRGEGLISYGTFKYMIEKELCNEFTHPRNVAAGMINGSDAEKAKLAEVVFFGAKFKGTDEFSMPILEQYALLDSLDLNRCEYIHTYEKNAQLMEWWSEVKPNGGYMYPLDGLVQTARIDGKDVQRKIKFKPEDYAEMEVKVTLRTTRTGRVIPHCTFVNPKFISGATIRQCTLNNVNWCRYNFKDEHGDALPIWDGAVVKVRRANEVIPEIFEVVSPAVMPSDSAIAISAGVQNWERKGTDIIDLDSKYNEANVVWNLLSWYSPKGVGNSLINEMYNVVCESGTLKEAVDHLQYWGTADNEYKSSILDDRFSGDVTKQRVRDTFDTICYTSITLAHLLQVLSIPSFGGTKCLKAEDAYYDNHRCDMEKFMDHWIPEPKHDQMNILVQFFKTRIEHTEAPVEPEVPAAEGRAFSLTGKLVGFKKAEFAEKCAEFGATWNDKEYDIMVTDSDRMSSKMQKAVDAGKKIMSTADFLQYIGV